MNDQELWFHWVVKCLTCEVEIEQVVTNGIMIERNGFVTYPDGSFTIPHKSEWMAVIPAPHPLGDRVRGTKLSIGNDRYLTDNIEQALIDDFIRVWFL